MLLEKIKQDALSARKAREGNRALLLVTLYAEAAKVGKDAGNRDSTDDEVVKVVRKFMKAQEEALGVIKDEAALAVVRFEISVLQAYLPAQMDSDNLAAVINEIIAVTPGEGMKRLGAVMGELKKRLGSTFDAAEASVLIKKRLV